MKVDRKSVLFTCVLAVLTVLLLEGTLAVLARVSTRMRGLLASPWVSYTIPDVRLGHRPNPAYPEHDANGFRNPRVPRAVEVVVLGDSQSYGTGVGAEEAWPSRLAELTGRSVYNMSFGGYGPAHALFYWDDAAALRPRVVLEAVYAGNDYFDCWDLVYNRGQLPELESPDAAERQRVRDAEAAAPLAEKVGALFAMDDEGAPAEQGWTTSPETGASLTRWIADRSSLYALARRGRYEWERRAQGRKVPTHDDWERAVAFARRHPDFCQLFEGPRARTVFTSAYRLAAIDQSDPRIHEGLQIALRALRLARERAGAAGARFVVVLIPTKELAFAELVGEPPEIYTQLLENETLARHTMMAFLDANGIEYVDTLPALREQLAAGPQPYHLDHNGHPNSHGHRAIAALVARTLAP